MSHFKVRENEIVGGGIGCQIQSLQFYPSHFLPQNSGKCICRGWGVIFVQKLQHLVHLQQVKLHVLPLSFSFSHLKTRENVGVGCW